MTKRLYLMQGVPGSGKSWLATHLVEMFERNETSVAYLSTDRWRFENGTYKYDPETNKAFHSACQKACIEAMQEGKEVIIIDNTNITKWQAEPYLMMARIFDYEVQVIRVDAPVDVAIERQKTRTEDRQVPANVIRSMYEQMERLL